MDMTWQVWGGKVILLLGGNEEYSLRVCQSLEVKSHIWLLVNDPGTNGGIGGYGGQDVQPKPRMRERERERVRFHLRNPLN